MLERWSEDLIAFVQMCVMKVKVVEERDWRFCDTCWIEYIWVLGNYILQHW